MTIAVFRRGLTFAPIAAAALILAVIDPSMAQSTQSVAASMVGAGGQPLSAGSVVVFDETDQVMATGSTDDKGRLCIDNPALEIGKTYRVCAREADQPIGPCTTAVASAADCPTALAALGDPVAAPAGSATGAAAGGFVASDVVAIGLGAAAAAGGIALGITETSGSGPTNPSAASRSQ